MSVTLKTNIFDAEILANNSSFIVSQDSPIKKAIATIKNLVTKDSLISDVAALQTIALKNNLEITRNNELADVGSAFVVKLGGETLFAQGANGKITINIANQAAHRDTTRNKIIRISDSIQQPLLQARSPLDCCVIL